MNWICNRVNENKKKNGCKVVTMWAKQASIVLPCWSGRWSIIIRFLITMMVCASITSIKYKWKHTLRSVDWNFNQFELYAPKWFKVLTFDSVYIQKLYRHMCPHIKVLAIIPSHGSSWSINDRLFNLIEQR